MQLVLLLEACRCVDRLDKLNAQLTGTDREWLRVDPDFDDPSVEVVVVVDKALAEVRQQETALKGLIGEIRQADRVAKPGASGKPATGVAPGAASGVKEAGVGDLTSRISARRTNPTAG